MRLTRRALMAAGLGIIALAGCRGQEPAPIIGRLAPDFRLTTIEGETLALSSLRGKPVVINFFATWCIPCKTELPAFQEAGQRYADRQLTFVLVDVQEDPDDVAVFLGDLNVTLPAVVDSTGETTKTYRIRGLPSTFFVGRDGVIQALQLGALDERMLESGLSRIV